MSAFESFGRSIIWVVGSFVRIVILPRYLFSRRAWIRPIVPLPLFCMLEIGLILLLGVLVRTLQ